ncbi:hypothetical protein BC332_03227 [Capsicum chinense]|nr:hypothetical protein BC332_03227 [Capsicum chinense]
MVSKRKSNYGKKVEKKTTVSCKESLAETSMVVKEVQVEELGYSGFGVFIHKYQRCSNVLNWLSDTEIYLDAMGLGDSIKKENTASSQNRAKAMIFLHHHLDEILKIESLTTKDPFVLWNSLKERRWTQGIRHDSEVYHIVVPMRDQLDHMTEVQVLKGPIFSDVEYVEPPASPGRGGRGCGRGHGCEHKHEGIVSMQRGGRGQGHLSVQPKPQIHLILDPEPHLVAKVEHISDIGTTQIPPFDPSSYMPACSSMPQPHHFSTYIAPSLVDEEILHLSLCSISKYPSELVAPCTSQPTTDDPVDTQVLEAAHSVIPDASHAPTDVTKKTQDPVYKNKRKKKKQCADPIAAITRKYHNDGDDDAHGGA